IDSEPAGTSAGTPGPKAESPEKAKTDDNQTIKQVAKADSQEKAKTGSSPTVREGSKADSQEKAKTV
ncbi:MAG TPA: hypothetical protein VII34_13295, partial [Pyrinomonadaceae bacterium]